MRNLLTFIIVFTFSISYGQNALLKVQKVFPNEKEKVNFIKFVINEHRFGEKDTVINIKINKKGFDSCYAIINNDTLKFKTKFKEKETYEIKQGCCCAAFTLEAQNNPKRGTVKFKNRTNRNLELIVAEANFENVKAGKTQNIYASESAMCFFKPCSILLTETEYLSKKYDYIHDKRDYDTLWKEQEKFIISSTWYHFLHGEKIEIIYNKKTKTLDLKHNGYLTENEFKKTIEKFNKNIEE